MGSETAINFKNPPIQEVVYSFQFKAIPEFHLGYIGLLWGELQDEFPTVEFDNPLERQEEKFGIVRPSPPKFQFLQAVPVPRFRMVSKDNAHLLQVQSDRIVFNWRRFQEHELEYPRFAALKDKFARYISHLESFLEAQNLGSISYDQVEITNINHIPVNGREFGEVFTGLDCGKDLSSDLQSESFLFQLKQLILSHDNQTPLGRLYTRIEKAQLISDGSDIFKMNLTARAHPRKSSTRAAFEMLTILRDCINTSFVGFTKNEMHIEWGKE